VIGTGRELVDGSGEVVRTRVAGEHDRASSPGRGLVHARSVMRRRPELVQDLDQPAHLARTSRGSATVFLILLRVASDGRAEAVEHGQDFLCAGNIPHRLAVPGGSHDAIRINDQDGWHASQLEELYFLTEKFGDPVLRVGHRRKRYPFLLPEAGKRARSIGRDRDDRATPLAEFVIVLAQLRQVPSAIGSTQAAQEDDDRWTTTQRSAADRLARERNGLPFRQPITWLESRHVRPPRGTPPRAERT